MNKIKHILIIVTLILPVFIGILTIVPQLTVKVSANEFTSAFVYYENFEDDTYGLTEEYVNSDENWYNISDNYSGMTLNDTHISNSGYSGSQGIYVDDDVTGYEGFMFELTNTTNATYLNWSMYLHEYNYGNFDDMAIHLYENNTVICSYVYRGTSSHPQLWVYYNNPYTYSVLISNPSYYSYWHNVSIIFNWTTNEFRSYVKVDNFAGSVVDNEVWRDFRNNANGLSDIVVRGSVNARRIIIDNFEFGTNRTLGAVGGVTPSQYPQINGTGSEHGIIDSYGNYMFNASKIPLDAHGYFINVSQDMGKNISYYTVVHPYYNVNYPDSETWEAEYWNLSYYIYYYDLFDTWDINPDNNNLSLVERNMALNSYATTGVPSEKEYAILAHYYEWKDYDKINFSYWNFTQNSSTLYDVIEWADERVINSTWETGLIEDGNGTIWFNFTGGLTENTEYFIPLLLYTNDSYWTIQYFRFVTTYANTFNITSYSPEYQSSGVNVSIPYLNYTVVDTYGENFNWTIQLFYYDNSTLVNYSSGNNTVSGSDIGCYINKSLHYFEYYKVLINLTSTNVSRNTTFSFEARFETQANTTLPYVSGYSVMETLTEYYDSHIDVPVNAYGYRLNFTDNDGDNISVAVNITTQDVSNSGWILEFINYPSRWTTAHITGGSGNVTMIFDEIYSNLSYGTDYYVRVMMQDDNASFVLFREFVFKTENYFNFNPLGYGEFPEWGSENISILTNIGLNVRDYDGDNITAEFYDNEGTLLGIDTALNGNGVVYIEFPYTLEDNTKYYWQVHLIDTNGGSSWYPMGTSINPNVYYNFTTVEIETPYIQFILKDSITYSNLQYVNITNLETNDIYETDSDGTYILILNNSYLGETLSFSYTKTNYQPSYNKETSVLFEGKNKVVVYLVRTETKIISDSGGNIGLSEPQLMILISLMIFAGLALPTMKVTGNFHGGLSMGFIGLGICALMGWIYFWFILLILLDTALRLGWLGVSKLTT